MEAIPYLRCGERGENQLMGKRHVHTDCYEILQVMDGSGSMVIGDRLYPLNPGAVFLIRPNTVHNSAPSQGRYWRNTVNIRASWLEQLCAAGDCREAVEALLDKQCLSVQAPTDEILSGQFKRLGEAAGGLGQLTAVSQMLSALLTDRVQRLPEQNNKVSQILKYIDENLTEPLTLDRLCGELYLSKYHFCRLFREYTHMSPMSYILARRLSLARELLLHTELPISAVAEASGFQSASNFSNLFFKNEGISPRDYRRKEL